MADAEVQQAIEGGRPVRRVAVIDGNSLMHRAFHAVPPYMTAPDGRPTNAIFGFLSMLLKLAEDFRPDAIVAAFDHGIPAFRLEAIEQYKAQRPPTDPELKRQFPMLKELLRALAVPVVEAQGWEGDDILGTLAAQAAALGHECLLVTGDKDALQLVDENTKVINTKSGMSEVVVYDVEAVKQKWGLAPSQVPDFLGLMGDSSDNIPGVPGVGEKRARALLEQYGSLEQVLAQADNIKGKLGESLRANAELARSCRTAARICRDLELDCDLDSVHWPAFRAAEATAAFRELALASQLNKVLRLIEKKTDSADSRQISGGAVPAVVDAVACAAAPDTSDIPAAPAANCSPRRFLVGEAAACALEAALGSSEAIAVCIQEGGGGKTLFSEATPQLVWAGATVAAVLEGPTPTAELLARLLQEAAELVVFDFKELLRVCLPPDGSQAAFLSAAKIDTGRVFDCRLAAYLLDSSQTPADYQQLFALYLPDPSALAGLLDVGDSADSAVAAKNSAAAKPPEVTEYLQAADQLLAGSAAALTAAQQTAAEQAVGLLELAALLRQRLQDEGGQGCFADIEMPLVPVLAQMERDGVKVDTDTLQALSQAQDEELERLRSLAYQEAGEQFNLDSPKQLGVILFEKFKLPALKKKKTGYSTDASVLEELKPMHPLPGLMLEYRELAKLKTTYLDALPRLVAADGHLHTSFNQAVTATGRLSSSDPNLQNIPVRTDIGRMIRRAFIPDATALGITEAVFMAADYSQIELRLLAHLSGDAGLIEAFRIGTDFHASTAARVWGLPLDDVTPQLRSRAKAVNFGIIYGQQAYGLSQSLGVSFKEAQELIDRYFQSFPQVKEYLERIVADAHRLGWVETLFGRRRYIRELGSSNANLRHFGERTAMNHPMQGSAADIIKLAMIEIARRLRQDGFCSQLILQVHDELDFNAAATEVCALAAMVKAVMEGVVSLTVPLTVDISQGDSWAEAH